MKHKLKKKEQVASKLRKADSAIVSDSTVEEACEKLGISREAYLEYWEWWLEHFVYAGVGCD